MEIKKAIKRIVALGIGVSMLGATVMGAANLNDYPAPFVQNGKFSGTLVVGDNAAAQDVVGVSDIAMSLQFAASVKTGDASASTVTVEGDAYQISKSADKLNLYQNLNTVKETLTDADLNALADGSLKGKTTETYTQTLKIASGGAQVQWAKPSSDYDDLDPQLYLYFPSTSAVVDYKLNFGTGPASDFNSDKTRLDDIENEKISILGKEYTITKAENISTALKLTLMAGAVQDTLEVGQTKTYTINGVDYEVTVMIVSGDSSTNAVAKLIVNDQVTKSLSKDDIYSLDSGIDVGIKEVLPTKSGDVVQNLVEFYLGAQKLVLDGNDNTLDIGDQSDISDANVTTSTTMTTSEGKLNNLEIMWSPSSDVYVGPGMTLKEALDTVYDEEEYVTLFDKLGIDYQFNGVSAVNTEEVKLGREDDNSLRLTFTNKNGDEYKVPVFYTSAAASAVTLGKDASEVLSVTQGATIHDEYMFAVESDDISRVLQLKDIKNTSSTKEIKLKDLGTGSSTSYTYESDGGAEISLDGYTFDVTVRNGTSITLTDVTDDGSGSQIVSLFTKYGSALNITPRITTGTDAFNRTAGAFGDYDLTFIEDKDQQEDDDTIDRFGWNVTWDSTNANIDLTGIMNTTDGTGFSELNMKTLEGDSKKSEGYSKWGTFFQRDTNGDQDEWTITIPENELEAEVFVTAGTTTISSADAVEGEARIVNKIDVGATKLASEVAGLETSQNLILVGGPCANAAVEAASDEFPTCAAWPFEPGESIVQLVEQADGNVALLVAGTTAADTRTATGVVAEMTELQGLADGVTKQLITVVSGQSVLNNVPEVEEVMDAGTTDAGTTDAGTTDAGTTDAGTTDAGDGTGAQ